MDIKQIAEKKRELEKLVYEAVSKFEEETGTQVEDIDLFRATTYGGGSSLVAVQFTVEIK